MRRTKSGLPKHCAWNMDRHGKRRVRFRKRGFSTYLAGIPWSEDFMRQHAAALEGVVTRKAQIGADRNLPNSLGALIKTYLDPNSTSLFKTRAAETQRTQRNILENFAAQHGDKPIFRTDHNGRRTMLLTREHMQAIVNGKAATPFAQRNFLNTAHVMFQWAAAEGRIPLNPTLGVTREKVKTTGYRTWSETEIAQFEAKHPIGAKARLAFALLLYTGQRRGDVVKFGRRHIHGDLLIIDQGKTEGGEEAHLENSGASKIARDRRGDAHGRRQDVSRDALRQALHGARLRQLVPRALRRRRMPRRVGARFAEGVRAATRRDRMLGQPDRRDHRPCHAQGGRAVHERRRPEAHGARGDSEAH
jgi:integrase